MTTTTHHPAPPDAGPWLDTLIGLGQVWILPTRFLPGVERIAGLAVRRADGIYLPYLAHPVTRHRKDHTRG